MSNIPQLSPEQEQALDAMAAAVRAALEVAPAYEVRERLDALRPEIDEADWPRQHALLGELLDELDAEFGPVPPEVMEEVERQLDALFEDE
jgi:hypothetical protein